MLLLMTSSPVNTFQIVWAFKLKGFRYTTPIACDECMWKDTCLECNCWHMPILALSVYGYLNSWSTVSSMENIDIPMCDSPHTVNAGYRSIRYSLLSLICTLGVTWSSFYLPPQTVVSPSPPFARERRKSSLSHVWHDSPNAHKSLGQNKLHPDWDNLPQTDLILLEEMCDQILLFELIRNNTEYFTNTAQSCQTPQYCTITTPWSTQDPRSKPRGFWISMVVFTRSHI